MGLIRTKINRFQDLLDTTRPAGGDNNKLYRWDNDVGVFEPVAVFVDDSGKVGIGTSSPSQLLEIKSSITTITQSTTISTAGQGIFRTKADVAQGVAVMTMIQGVWRGSAGLSVMVGVTPVAADASADGKNAIEASTRHSIASTRHSATHDTSRKRQNLQIADSIHNCAGQQNKERIYQDCFQHSMHPLNQIPAAVAASPHGSGPV